MQQKDVGVWIVGKILSHMIMFIFQSGNLIACNWNLEHYVVAQMILVMLVQRVGSKNVVVLIEIKSSIPYVCIKTFFL